MTSAERAVRLAVEGGYLIKYEMRRAVAAIESALGASTFKEAVENRAFATELGKRCGWSDMTPEEKIINAVIGGPREGWKENWVGLIYHLAAHPGDHEGYLATLITDANVDE